MRSPSPSRPAAPVTVNGPPAVPETVTEPTCCASMRTCVGCCDRSEAPRPSARRPAAPSTIVNRPLRRRRTARRLPSSAVAAPRAFDPGQLRIGAATVRQFAPITRVVHHCRCKMMSLLYLGRPTFFVRRTAPLGSSISRIDQPRRWSRCIGSSSRSGDGAEAKLCVRVPANWGARRIDRLFSRAHYRSNAVRLPAPVRR